MTISLKSQLTQHLQQIIRERDPYLASEGHFYVREYIRQQLQQWGTVITDEFEQRGKKHQNLILNLPGISKSKNSIIVIGAHYDAVPGCPGADDNGTGVAALLELAKAIAEHPLKYPVQCVAFDLEEFGFLGSQHYAESLKQQNQSIRLMLSLEMLGYCNPNPNSQKYPPGLKYFYPNCGDYIALIGNLKTIPDLIRISRGIRQTKTPCQWLPVPNRGIMVPDTRRSDQVPFWDLGYAAIMVTDTANLRNPHYHQP
ncbi:MAG: M28 family peptidase, partial [Planktothrix agardhii KL2]|nr:M28 family peptidase [Planktothrix agardhii KL2]